MNACRAGRSVPGVASGGAGDDREVALVAGQGDPRVRRGAARGSLPEEICAWRLTVPEGHRFEATQALRQVLNRAVAWELIDVNPAKRGVRNPLRRFPEKRPFESWHQIHAVAARLGPVQGRWSCSVRRPGCGRPNSSALEQRDIDRRRRRRLCAPAARERPSQADEDAAQRARGAAASRSRSRRSTSSPLESPICCFPAPRGGSHRPAQLPTPASGDPHRSPPASSRSAALRSASHLRHLRAPCRDLGLRLSRFMGASIAMIDRTTATSPATAANMPSRSSTHSRSSRPWTLRGRRAARKQPARPQRLSQHSAASISRSGGRSVDAAPRTSPRRSKTKGVAKQELLEAL